MISLTEILVALITVAATLAAAYVIPWVRKMKTTEELDQLMIWVDVGVRAAEQLAKDKGWNGEQKCEYVTQFLADKGFGVDIPALKAAIEAAVYDLKAELFEIEVD